MAYVRDLKVYNDAVNLSNMIWRICIKWDYFAKKTIGDQLVRSIDSVSANIAEGYGRDSIKDNLRFCFYARGSIEEPKDWLFKSQYRNLINPDQYKEIYSETEKVSKELWRYIQSLRKKINANK